MSKNPLPLIVLMLIILSKISFGQCQYGWPESAAFDNIRNRYLISDVGNGNIYQLDSLGVLSCFSQSLSITQGLYIRNDTLFVAASNSGLIGFDLETAEIIMDVDFPGQVNPNDVVPDNSGNIYVSDPQGNSIYKLDLSDMSTTTIVSGFTMANGMWFDEENNRLLAVQWIENSPVSAIDLSDYTVTAVADDGLDLLDGIQRDRFGNYYISSFGSDAIHVYDSDFSGPPQIYSSGHVDPGDIHINEWNCEMAIPCINGATVNFIDMYFTIEADTLWGFPPLEVNFSVDSDVPIDVLNWDFGDEEFSSEESPTHLYMNSGIFDVSLEIESGDVTFNKQKKQYIIALGDTISCPNINGEPNTTVDVEIFINNTVPVSDLWIPIKYQGPIGLILESYTLTGCRTEHFDNIHEVSHFPSVREVYYHIYNDSWSGTPDLEAGEGPVLKLSFSIPSSASYGQINSISAKSISLDRNLLFEGDRFDYVPYYIDGRISLIECGDANGDGSVNILDIVYLINYKYKSGPEPFLPELADVNSDEMVNILDIVYLINYKYKSGPEPVCP